MKDLNKWLAENVMGWTLQHDWWYDEDTLFICSGNDNCEEGLQHDHWDPCCNPAHGGMLEQKMADLGWGAGMKYDPKKKIYLCWFTIKGWVSTFHYKWIKIRATYDSRLHATAVAADEVTKNG